jgi:hypothetical protein
MPLPHYTKLVNGTPIPEEVVYLNLFEITFILPTLVSQQVGTDVGSVLLLQNALNIDMNLTQFDVGVKEQKFKYSTRQFLTTPTKTSGEFNIKFNVNVNQGSMETWNVLKTWYDLVFNSQTGALHYKSDIVGTVIVNQHDKKGFVLRRVSFWNVQIKQLGGYALDWSSNNIMENLQADFIYDYFSDEYIGGDGYTIAAPTVTPGY